MSNNNVYLVPYYVFGEDFGLFVQRIKNNDPEIINIKFQEVGRAGLIFLLQVLKENSCVKNIDFSGLEFDFNQVSHIANFLKDCCHDHNVFFSNTNLDDAGAKRLIAALKNNKSKIVVVLDGCQFVSENLIQQLARVPELKKQLEAIKAEYINHISPSMVTWKSYWKLFETCLSKVACIEILLARAEFSFFVANKPNQHTAKKRAFLKGARSDYEAVINMDSKSQQARACLESIELLLEKSNPYEKIKGEELNGAQALGEGSFGKVTSGTYNNDPVAIKLFREGGLWSARDGLEYEAEIMTEAQSPYVVGIFGVVPKTCLVMELMAKNSLSELLIKESKNLSWDEKIRIALGVARGLADLHRRQILHLDLSLSNILIGDDGSAKLTDFGFSKVMKKDQEIIELDKNGNVLFSQAWRAPEVLSEDPWCSKKSDIFSFGVVLRKIASLQSAIPKNTPSSYVDLMEVCCSQESDDRPAADEVVERLEKMVAVDSYRMQRPNMQSCR